MAPKGRMITVAATAADPRNAITFWNAMRRWFTEHGFPIEYALFSTYDGLCRALLDGAVIRHHQAGHRQAAARLSLSLGGELTVYDRHPRRSRLPLRQLADG